MPTSMRKSKSYLGDPNSSLASHVHLNIKIEDSVFFLDNYLHVSTPDVTAHDTPLLVFSQCSKVLHLWGGCVFGD